MDIVKEYRQLQHGRVNRFFIFILRELLKQLKAVMTGHHSDWALVHAAHDDNRTVYCRYELKEPCHIHEWHYTPIMDIQIQQKLGTRYHTLDADNAAKIADASRLRMQYIDGVQQKLQRYYGIDVVDLKIPESVFAYLMDLNPNWDSDVQKAALDVHLVKVAKEWRLGTTLHKDAEAVTLVETYEMGDYTVIVRTHLTEIAMQTLVLNNS